MYKLTPILTTLALTLGCGAPVGNLDRASVGVNEEGPILYVSESAVFFDSVCEGGAATHALTIGNVGDSPLVMTGLRLTGPGYALLNRPALPLTLGAGQMVNLVVRFTPADSRVLPYEGNLVVTSTDPFDPLYNISLFGVSLPGTVRVIPRTHDFGAVQAGNTRAFNYTVRATECPVFVSSARVTGQLAGTVSWGPLPGWLEPGQAELISVRVTCWGQDNNVDASVRFIDDAGRAVGSAQVDAFCEP